MAKFCPECAYPITDKNAQFCVKCGAALPVISPGVQTSVAEPTETKEPTQPSLSILPSNKVPTEPSESQSVRPVQGPTIDSPTKKRSTAEWIAICVGGLILLIIFSVFVAQFVYGTPGSSQKPTASAGIPHTTVTSTPTIDPVIQIKNNAHNIPYDDLFRNNENYVGKTVYFRGKIIQMAPLFGDNYVFRVATKSSQYLGYIEDVVYVNYKGSRFLEGDTIDLWAKVDGLKTYTAVLGNPVSVPELTALRTELVSKESDSSSIQPIASSTIAPSAIANTMSPWIQLTSSAEWQARESPSSVAMPDGSIVLMGGEDSSGNFKNDVWRSKDNGATWKQMTSSAGWVARAYHSSVAIPDGSIVLMGGKDSGGKLKNDVWRSTDYGATWKQMTANAKWSPRWTHSSIVTPDGSIVLMGGRESSGDMDDVWKSTDNGATWTQMTASAEWSARMQHSSVTMPDGSIVLMGGGDSTKGWKNDVWRSTDDGATWMQMTASAGWSARSGHSSVATPDGSVVLMGGFSGHGFNDVWQSTDDGTTWTRLTQNAGWSPRWTHSSVMMRDGSIVLMGGYSDIKNWKNDVWRFTPSGWK